MRRETLLEAFEHLPTEEKRAFLAEAGRLAPFADCSQLRQQLQTLRSHYTFVSSDNLIAKALTEVPALYQLLNGAVEPLRRAFGENTELQLEALESDDEGSILRAVVRVAPHLENPAELMRGFQQNWWFEHCSRSEASLVFDYEIANGI